MSNLDVGFVRYPEACPGCAPEYDPRTHNQRWCASCRPSNGTHERPPLGDADGQARAGYLGGGGSAEPDPACQRAAAAMWPGWAQPEDLVC